MNDPERAAPAIPTPVLPERFSIKFIGAGGVGAPCIRYAALFLSSPAFNHCEVRIVVIDGDEFEPANAGRMLFRNLKNKAEEIRAELIEFLGQSRLTLIAVPEYVTEENLPRLVGEGDVVVLAVDNHRTRQLISDHVASLRDCCLISAGNDPAGRDSSGRVRRGTYGNCQVYIRRDGRDLTPSLTRWHPEIAEPADSLPTEASCTELAVSVPQILFTNLQTASCALAALYRYLCGVPAFPEVSFDLFDAVMRPVPIPLERRRASPARP